MTEPKDLTISEIILLFILSVHIYLRYFINIVFLTGIFIQTDNWTHCRIYNVFLMKDAKFTVVVFAYIIEHITASEENDNLIAGINQLQAGNIKPVAGYDRYGINI